MRAFVQGRQVRCVFCQGEEFAEREIKLNTTGMSFFNLDWANKAAVGLICEGCGYIQMFLNPQLQFEGRR